MPTDEPTYNKPIVLVVWTDAAGGARTGWRPMDEVVKQGTATCYSVGFLLRKSRKDVLICPHVAALDGEHDGDAELCIPKSWVRSITVLQK